METTPEQLYSELLRQLASPFGTAPDALADAFREVERMHSAGQIADWQLQNAREAYARTGSKAGEAAHWVMGKAKDVLQSAAGQVRERSRTAVLTYAKDDPMRAMLIAAGAGALLMALVSMMGRAGVRKVRRRIRR